MKIITGYPPNFRDILAVFPMARSPSTVFAYGDRIYSMARGAIVPAVVAHEEAHGERQLGYHGSVDPELNIQMWWQRYLADPAFRLAEELVGHRAEYRWLLEHDPRNERRHRDIIAKRLSGPLYNRMISFADALQQVIGDAPVSAPMAERSWDVVNKRDPRYMLPVPDVIED